VLIFLVFAIRTSWFQTFAGQQAASYLSKELGKDISIGKIDIIFFDQFDIENVYVQDSKTDTLMYANLIGATIADWSLDDSFLKLDKILLSNTSVKLKKYEGDSVFNFQYIVDYFGTSEDTTSSDPFAVSLNKLTLDNINFIYQDQNAEQLVNGMDYSNLDIRNISGELSDFSLNGDSILININKLHLNDQSSGLQLKNLNAEVLYSPKVISLKKLNIALNNSNINAKHFELLTPNGTDDFNDFLNKVEFNSHLLNSKISLADVAYFVPSIWGMDDDVNINNCEINGVVNGMKLKNTDISMLEYTLLKGDFQIPNLDDIESAFIDEKVEIIRTSVSDIEHINLIPFLDGDKYFNIPDNFDVADVITLKNGHFTGFLNDFVVDGDLTTGLGNVYSENGLKFVKNEKDNLYHYQGAIPEGITKDVIVENLDLGAITSNSMLGKTTGFVKIKKGTKGFSPKDIYFKFLVKFSTTTLNDYTYKNILIKEGRYNDDRFTGVIDIKDDNLALNYDGYVDFKNELLFNFEVKIDSSYLAKMNLMPGDLSTRLCVKVRVNISGTSLDKIKGDVAVSDFSYYNGVKTLNLDTLGMSIKRSDSLQSIHLTSSYVDADLIGQYNFQHIYPVLKNQVALLISNYLDQEELPSHLNEQFSLDVNLKDINPLLDYFEVGAYVNPNSKIWGDYDMMTKKLDFNVKSDSIEYEGKSFSGIALSHNLDSTRGSIYYFIKDAKINDSISVKHLYFDSYIKPNKLFTNLGWDGNGNIEPALFAFNTDFASNGDIKADFFPSFFYLKGEKWDINSSSSLVWNPELLEISNFDIHNDLSIIGFNGKVSKEPSDWLNFRIKDFDLSNLNRFLGDMKLEGMLNLDGGIADIYNNVRFMAITDVKELNINNEKVGDLLVDSKWDKITNSVKVFGNLKRDDLETFNFHGDYYIEKEENSLDVFVSFDNTDIGFLNAFSDEELYTNIKGILDGDIHIGGVPTNPVIEGALQVVSANVKVPMFNVSFGVKGELDFGEGEIFANNLMLIDQEGNHSIGMMQIYHFDWGDWNYDIQLDMEDPNYTKTFLVMDTKYKEGDIYYGKAYITGNVNISGYGGITAIEVNAKTEKGTDLTLPLYGTSDLVEDDFIQFYNPNDTTAEDEKQEVVEKLGLTLAMNFEVTNDAKVKIVFDPVYNDEIVAVGEGPIELTMDNYGEMTMFGKFTINEGVYHMNMKNVVAEDFEIIDGSTVAWTGSPYDANIDISTRFERNCDMSDIMTSSLSGSSRKDQVFGYLNLSNTLMKPVLSFDIRAPKARDEAKKALNQIRAVEDELNKQFFALLMIKKFIPVAGSGDGSGGGNVATDLLNQQINGVLGQIGENYDLQSNIGTDRAALGFSTSFLDDKLKVTTSVGVMTADENNSAASNIVGDVNIEYELNDDGTFTVNVFNESNDEAADQEQGHFTQGVGLNYQEKFYSTKDFKLLQGFLNIFRTSENDVHIRNKRQGNGRKVRVQENFDPENIEEN
jgi:hypothetical protein